VQLLDISINVQQPGRNSSHNKVSGTAIHLDHRRGESVMLTFLDIRNQKQRSFDASVVELAFKLEGGT